VNKSLISEISGNLKIINLFVANQLNFIREAILCCIEVSKHDICIGQGHGLVIPYGPSNTYNYKDLKSWQNSASKSILELPAYRESFAQELANSIIFSGLRGEHCRLDFFDLGQAIGTKHILIRLDIHDLAYELSM
jgi:hypothetical protein